MDLNNVANIQKSILRRRKEDSERYFSLYNIRQDDEKNYDLIVDTTNLPIEKVFLTVMNFIDLKRNGAIN
jgi:cytidylate kinase